MWAHEMYLLKKNAVINNNVGYFVKTSFTSKSGCLLQKFWNQTGSLLQRKKRAQRFGLLEADLEAPKRESFLHMRTPKRKFRCPLQKADCSKGKPCLSTIIFEGGVIHLDSQWVWVLNFKLFVNWTAKLVKSSEQLFEGSDLCEVILLMAHVTRIY